MVQKIMKVTAIVTLVALVLLSVGYNAYIFLKTYEFNLQQQGLNTAVAQIGATVSQKGSIELPLFGQDGKQSGTITLIQKPNDTKK